MKAVWLEDRQVSVRSVEAAARAGEALIRVRLAGICGTDLELVRGYYPYTGVLGHEFVGEIAALPGGTSEGDGLSVGTRVVGEINATCGACEPCRGGRPTHCDRRSVLGIVSRDGAFAEFLSLPLGCLHTVPDAVPDEAAVFTEPLAAALEIQQQIQIRPDDRVLLVGAGRLGQLIAQTLALTGARLQVVARHPWQQSRLERRGIAVIGEADVVARGYDVVVEATGSPSGFGLARRAVRARGTFVLKSTYHGDLSLDMSSIVVDEITLVGSRCGPFAPALRLMAQGLVDLDELVEARYPLDAAHEALEHAGRPGCMKVLFDPAGRI